MNMQPLVVEHDETVAVPTKAAEHALPSQQLQEQYAIRIARIPDAIRNLSYKEGNARIFKFAILFNVLSGADLSQSVDYYDSFTGELLTENEEIDFIQL